MGARVCEVWGRGGVGVAAAADGGGEVAVRCAALHGAGGKGEGGYVCVHGAEGLIVKGKGVRTGSCWLV